MNNLNKFLTLLTLILLVVYGSLLQKEKPWSKYYYEVFAFYPEEFPLKISRLSFTSNKLKDLEYDHYSRINISNHGVKWMASGYSNQTHKKRLLPDNIYVEYVDLRTKKYYSDTIPLPIKKIKRIFKKAKSKYLLQNLDTYYTCMGLTFYIGIANDGNILVWLSNTDYPNNFEIEVLRVKIPSKTFPKNWERNNTKFKNKDEFIKKRLNNLTNSEKKALIKPINSKTQFKDSIPKRFRNLIKSLE